MPVYQYRGTECGHEFEVRQSFADDPITVCPECGRPVRRVIHASPIVFKGSGWYITDSKPTHDSSGGVQDVNKKQNGKDDAADSATPAKTEAKTESTTSDKPAKTDKASSATT